MNRDFIAIDLETTGLNPLKGDRVIEVAAIRFKEGYAVDKFTSLVQTARRISSAASRITGLTKEDLKLAPLPELVFKELIDFVGSSQLVAHNAPFEKAFLRSEYTHVGCKFENMILCSLKLSRAVLPGLKSYSLGKVAEYLGVEYQSNQLHRANEDARTTAKIWIALNNI
jgi:DNA polymerase III subunit epsilon